MPTDASSAVADFVAGRAEHPPRHDAAPAPVAPPTSTSSLDLSETPTTEATPATNTTAPRLRVRVGRRISADGHQLLSITEPTVTLTRVQSGIGQLAIEAVCSPEVGDLRLGAAYELRDGSTSTVQLVGDRRFGPSVQRPVLVAGRDEYEHLGIDLRRCHELQRLGVYAFSESRADLVWGGTLVVTTYGGARIDLPLETLHRGQVAVLLSIYNLDGEFVIRAEMETLPEGSGVREAARAYGYDRITWRDDRLPAD
jgi:uncharacterized protein involved in tellurium resistance